MHANHSKLYAQLNSLYDLLACTDHQIHAWTGRRSGFLQQLQEQVQSLPRYQVTVSQKGYQHETRQASVMILFDQLTAHVPRESSHSAHLIVGTLKGELVWYRKVRLNDFPVPIKIETAMGTQIKAFVIDDQIGQASGCGDREGRQSGRQLNIGSSSLSFAACCLSPVGIDQSGFEYLRYGLDADGHLPMNQAS